MKALILATAMAVGFASYASAAEVKKDTKKAPVVASKAMTDADMDKVTAGQGFGVYTAFIENPSGTGASGPPNGIPTGIGTAYEAGGLGRGNPPGGVPFFGNYTAGNVP